MVVGGPYEAPENKPVSKSSVHVCSNAFFILKKLDIIDVYLSLNKLLELLKALHYSFQVNR